MKLGPACDTCPYRDRPGPVLTDGPKDAMIFFVGEGPGWDEVREGKGFVGAAGYELFTLANAVGISRSQVRCGNLVKCLPHGAEKGVYKLDPDAIRACSIYLEEELRAWSGIKREREPILVPVGAVAAEAIAELKPIRRWRGAVVKRLLSLARLRTSSSEGT